MADWLGLAGRICVITGGGGGIGRAAGVGFAEQGCAVALLDRDLATAEASAALARAHGVTAIALACDITDQSAIAAVAAQVAAELGPVDILYNNAGAIRADPLATISLADWQGLMNINLNGALLCSQIFGAVMLERGRGAIVHTASIAGQTPQPWSGAYSASKAGVRMLSRQLAQEWGPRGVRSNTVSPGLVRTPMSEAFYQQPGVAERRAAIVPTRRVATPEDIANAALFLASDRASYINGADILVDGGLDGVLMGLVPRPGFEQHGNA